MKRDIGDEGYCWERTKVHEEESDRLCVCQACGTTMHVLPVGVHTAGSWRTSTGRDMAGCQSDGLRVSI